MGLIMDDKLKQRFDEVQKLYLDAINLYAPEYDIHAQIKDLAEVRRNDKVLSRIQKNFLPSFSLQVVMSSEKLVKKLEFKISDGTNVEGVYYHSLDFSIEHGKNWFSIQNYFTHNGIEDKIDDFFDASDYDETTQKINKFIEQIVFVLKQDDIKHILTSKDWLHVPHDKSMYF